MSKISFQQKRKHRSILPSSGSIDEEVILESQKTKTNKSLLDFKSPKLSRLKNFIKSPVQKTYNKYRQFQDNEEDSSLTQTTLDIRANKPGSLENIDADSDSTNAMDPESKARSQTSILTTITSIQTDSNLASPLLDKQDKCSTNISKSAKSSNTSGNMSVTNDPCDQDNQTNNATNARVSNCVKLVKSASISVLAKCQMFDDSVDQVPTDKTDGSDNNAVVSSGDDSSYAMKWNAALVDIEMTIIMLQSLDDHIKVKRDKITKDISQKEEMVDKLIANFTLMRDCKSSKKVLRDYETMNKSSERSLEKSKMELKQLEYKRLIVSQEGIPWGVKPADYVKNISKRDRSKKSIDPPLKEAPGPIARLFKGYAKRSVSAENVSQLANNILETNETPINKPWLPNSASVKKNKDADQTSPKAGESPKSSLPNNDQATIFSRPNNSSQNFQKPCSLGNSSGVSWDVHGGDSGSQMRKSKSNSVSSYTGRDHVVDTQTDSHEPPRNLSFSVASIDETPKSDELSVSRLQLLQEDMNCVKRELQEVRSECHVFQCEVDNIRLDMDTNAELYSQKMQNAIERVDRLERILDTLRQQCQIEFCTWKNGFRSLEEKLDYRLTTSRRDLQDNIDACNNSISLVEKRTEQLPFVTNRSGRSDVKIITDHLCNLAVSLVAFIMLLVSSGFHLLIKVLNVGATISQHRNSLLIPIMLVLVLLLATVKWPSLRHLLSSISDTDSPVL